MANKPLLPPDQWEALKLLSVQGICDRELSDRFGVSPNAIAARRFDDPVWKAAVLAMRKGGLSKVTESNEKAEIASKVASTISDNIASLGESNRLLALQIASKGLKQADQAPPDVTSWGDVKALVEIVHKASGMESGNAVQVNVLSSGGYEFSPASVEIAESINYTQDN